MQLLKEILVYDMNQNKVTQICKCMANILSHIIFDLFTKKTFYYDSTDVVDEIAKNCVIRHSNEHFSKIIWFQGWNQDLK